MEEKGIRVAQLLGRHRYQLDSKGRIPLPARYRDALEEGVFLTVGQDGGLYAFPPDEWDRFTAQVPTSPLAAAPERDYARMLGSRAERLSLDRQGRLLIPQDMRREIRLDREAMVVGVFNRLEIWSAPEWDRYELARKGPYLEGTLSLAAQGRS